MLVIDSVNRRRLSLPCFSYSGNQFVTGPQGTVGQINEVPDLEEHNSKANNRIGHWIRPRPHVSGDFCIRKYFYADTKISASTRSVYESYTTVHTYPIRIRTSQRISQQSMRITSAYTKIYGYERPHVSGYTAYTEISTLESVYRNLRIHRAYTADTCGR